ncbi:SMI1/KNR4 family protein [Photobacterium sp. DNB23_23_1]
MEYKDVINNWQKFAEAINRMGGEVQALTIEEPASTDDIFTLEEKLGFSIPSSLREVLLNFSRKVEFRWCFPDNYELEGELNQIFCGERHWSLDWIVEFNEDKNGWVEECFPDENDPYDIVWHNKLAFHEVGNGDYLAIDLRDPDRQPVVYLSHDDGEGHGVELAENFKEFLFVSSRIGCVGGEDFQLLPFIEEGKPYLNADCFNTQQFRRYLKVEV